MLFVSKHYVKDQTASMPACLQEDGASESSAPNLDERPAHLQWQGRDTQYMKANEYSGERSGVWNSTGLEGAAKSIVEGDEQAARRVCPQKFT